MTPGLDRWLTREETMAEKKRIGKVADKPHWITILIGTLGPTVALCAVAFTYFSFRISHESLRVSQRALETSERGLSIAQRAYVSIRNGRFDVAGSKRRYSRHYPHILEWSPPAEDPELFQNVDTKYSMEIWNLGNTPARSIELEVRIKVPPLDWGQYFRRESKNELVWERYEDDVVLTHKNIGDIGQKTSEGRSYSHTFWLMPNARQRLVRDRYLSSNGISDTPGPLVLRGKLQYVDVLGAKELVEWCWLSSPW